MSKATKLYPIARRWTHDAPHAVHIVDTKAEADALIAGGAFTDDPSHADRDHDAPDLTLGPGGDGVVGESGPETVVLQPEPEPA